MLLRNLEIRDFRGFRRFRLNEMGRVNLLVGTNNCGKTSVLEAVSILLADGDFAPIWNSLRRRGEDLPGAIKPTSAGDPIPQVDVRRLFHGHVLDVGGRFEITAGSASGRRTLTASIDDEPSAAQLTLFDMQSAGPESLEEFLPPLWLSLSWDAGQTRELRFPLGRRGGVSGRASYNSPQIGTVDAKPIRFITAMSLTAGAAGSLFDEVVLTPKEEMVLDAMRLIDPRIERIAFSGSEGGYRKGGRTKGGILVRLKGYDDRVPIGSMGDGIWRMFGLALSVVRSARGVLLVDEIDTGLHYTVMRDMWRFLYQCAKRYDVQVVATTHSWDCCQALAAICREDVAEGGDVTLSRIERDREEAVTYSEQEILAVAERDIEVR